MFPIEHQSYVATVRLKQGEYLALSETSSDVAERLLPHFVLPPPKDRDPEKGRVLTTDEIVYENGLRVGKYWPFRTCLLDPRFLFKRLGTSEAKVWLPRLFRTAANSNARAIPVCTLADLEGDRLQAFQAITNPGDVGVALRLTLRDLGDERLQNRVHAALLKIVALPSQCILVLDLSGADFSATESVAEFIVGAFQRVFEIGRWRRIVTTATSYPEKNPAEENGEVLLQRNEWDAWNIAVNHDSVIRQNLMYGDFAADSSKFVFSGGTTPIRHYRYTSEKGWFVVRGSKSIELKATMVDVATRIVKSRHFLGKNFSTADRFIFETANGAASGPGNAMIWRKVNTIHHLTLIIRDLGRVYGYKIRELAEAETGFQPDLFRR